ncbi:MAG: RHS repeat-associated core domain-containing protein [Acidobacteriota bacterium]
MTRTACCVGLAIVLTASWPAPAAAQPTVQYYHLDAVGSVRMITDQNGAVVAYHDYLPFGIETPTPTPTPTVADPRAFAGKERDQETGLDYFGARYYASQTGRFTTVDPGHVGGNILDSQSWNGYAYARNNPLKFTDPTGADYEICAYGGEGYSGSCGSVSDQHFSQLYQNPGEGVSLWGGAIFAANRIVGYYKYTGPGLNDFISLTGALSSRWLGEQSASMAIGTAIAATGGLAGGVLGGGLTATSTLGLEAPSMTELANFTARGARMANFAVNLTTGEFQSNLVRSGYKVIRQGVGSNGPWRMLGSGEKTYTIYMATSTGGPAAEVRVAGRLISKIRLGGF